MVMFFGRNQHHITKWQSCLKPIMNSEAARESHSYNLKSRKNNKSVRWPDIPIEASTGVKFKLPDEL